MAICIGLYALDHAPGNLPAYATPGSAAMDLQAAIAEPLVLAPMQRVLVPTGYVMEIPEGYEVQIRPRSGLAIKHGITLINAVGTIDADYRHEVKIPLVNLGNEAYTLQPGERVAQLLVAPVYPCSGRC
jgi:dUTP pyrophosphatase